MPEKEVYPIKNYYGGCGDPIFLDKYRLHKQDIHPVGDASHLLAYDAKSLCWITPDKIFGTPAG